MIKKILAFIAIGAPHGFSRSPYGVEYQKYPTGDSVLFTAHSPYLQHWMSLCQDSINGSNKMNSVQYIL